MDVRVVNSIDEGHVPGSAHFYTAKCSCYAAVCLFFALSPQGHSVRGSLQLGLTRFLFVESQVATTRDGAILAAGTDSALVHVWDARARQLRHSRTLRRHTDGVSQVSTLFSCGRLHQAGFCKFV